MISDALNAWYGFDIQNCRPFWSHDAMRLLDPNVGNASHIFHGEGSRESVYIALQPLICFTCSTTPITTPFVIYIHYNSHIRSLLLARFHIKPNSPPWNKTSPINDHQTSTQPHNHSPTAQQINMESIRLTRETFQILDDGRIAVPSWGTELLCVLMIYTPNSWKEIVRRLRRLQQFVQNLDEYALVYSFCMAMIVRNPILLGLVSHDPTTGHFRMIPGVEAIYGGEQNPLAFWATPEGQALRNTVSDVMASFRLRRQNAGEAAVHDRNVEEFRRQVDGFSSNRHSVSKTRFS